MNRVSLTELLCEQLRTKFSTQREASDKTGIHVPNISRFLSGKRSISLSSVDVIWPKLRLKIRPVVYDEVAKKEGFSSAMRMILKDQGLPDLEVARRTGIAQPTIWRFMEGQTLPKVSTFDAIWEDLPLEVYDGKKRVDVRPDA